MPALKYRDPADGQFKYYPSGPTGPTGPAGANGAQGIQGIQGPVGPGVVAGGTQYQRLGKKSATDYDTEWVGSLPTFTNYADLVAKWPSPAIGNTAMTLDNARLYSYRGAPWNIWMPTQGQTLYSSSVTGDVGSTNTGGPFTIVQYSLATYPYPVNLSLKAVATWGFGSLGTACCCYLKRPDGTIYDGSGYASYCDGGYWIRTPLNANVGIAANTDPSACVVIDGINFNGQNCYRNAHLDYTVFSI